MLSHWKVIFCILTLFQAIETYFQFVHSAVQLYNFLNSTCQTENNIAKGTQTTCSTPI